MISSSSFTNSYNGFIRCSYTWFLQLSFLASQLSSTNPRQFSLSIWRYSSQLCFSDSSAPRTNVLCGFPDNLIPATSIAVTNNQHILKQLNFFISNSVLYLVANKTKTRNSQLISVCILFLHCIISTFYFRCSSKVITLLLLLIPPSSFLPLFISVRFTLSLLKSRLFFPWSKLTKFPPPFPTSSPYYCNLFP